MVVTRAMSSASRYIVELACELFQVDIEIARGQSLYFRENGPLITPPFLLWVRKDLGCAPMHVAYPLLSALHNKSSDVLREVLDVPAGTRDLRVLMLTFTTPSHSAIFEQLLEHPSVRGNALPMTDLSGSICHEGVVMLVTKKYLDPKLLTKVSSRLSPASYRYLVANGMRVVLPLYLDAVCVQDRVDVARELMPFVELIRPGTIAANIIRRGAHLIIPFLIANNYVRLEDFVAAALPYLAHEPFPVEARVMERSGGGLFQVVVALRYTLLTTGLTHERAVDTYMALAAEPLDYRIGNYYFYRNLAMHTLYTTGDTDFYRAMDERNAPVPHVVDY